MLAVVSEMVTICCEYLFKCDHTYIHDCKTNKCTASVWVIVVYVKITIQAILNTFETDSGIIRH